MRNYTKFYIDGQWVDPAVPKQLDVINPATEAVAGVISMGSAADADRAVMAARKAFPGYSQTSRADRVELLQNILAKYQERFAEIAAASTGLAGHAGAGRNRCWPSDDRHRGAEELRVRKAARHHAHYP